ncbi:MAG: F0F1 ATP synthase subunit B [Propionibacteriaceae bacterium]|jgi:F-type H+-transporting ATPase subunit b|nr:F0F1 ATP synthase subunit B [Propionibacteriaceae bacterium]
MYPLEGTGPLGPLLPAHISELVVGLVLFAIIIFVVWKVIVPRFETMYTERADAIRGGIERAEQAQDEAAQALAAYREKLATADDEAARIRDAAKATGTQIEAEMRSKAEDDAARIVNSARAQVEAEKSLAMESLRKDVGQMATTLAGRILGESLDDDARVKKTVDSFIVSLSEDSPKK